MHGDDGSGPTLIATSARDGVFELRYRSTGFVDVLSLLVSLGGLLMCGALMFRPTRANRLLAPVQSGLSRAAHPMVVGALVLAVLAAVAVRWTRAADREQGQATAWVADGRAAISGHIKTSPLKAGMLIRPAVHPRWGTSQVVFANLTARAEVTGWVALDDDRTKLGKKGHWVVTSEVRPVGGEWGQPRDQTIAHRPGLTPLRVQAPADTAFDLRITTRSTDRPPAMGFDLDLEEMP